MLRIKIKILIIGIISFMLCSDTNDQYSYIDAIDQIQNLEEIAEKHLSLGDTTHAINTLIEITNYAELMAIYSDDLIAEKLYKIGELFLLTNNPINGERYFTSAYAIK